MALAISWGIAVKSMRLKAGWASIMFKINMFKISDSLL
jgi:hypothetical protein